jgi:hypothetical protein
MAGVLAAVGVLAAASLLLLLLLLLLLRIACQRVHHLACIWMVNPHVSSVVSVKLETSLVSPG